ncbi:Xaa-Pro aminopeptidase [Epibacterium ulvae]|uniref:Xaa-Pro aminopeptidase n=1 Tax=Epibacterium ulvae TaxID=1156985 RepID=A0A1G5QQM5_9RHOB|nr:aminopeptidase P family protein [Epibacterium ulvae]SCZ63878.1 Xaa-Pro aminopeptidase [Epibacterium ulvae]
MYQSFEVTARPEQGPARLADLRAEMARVGVDGFLIPRADAHQGEYVPPRDERLSWLTGFTGSAGFCVALEKVAGVFIDGRYRTQVKQQVADDFTPVPWPEVSLTDWLKEQLPHGGIVAYDPWLHAAGQIKQAEAALKGSGITLKRSENLVDQIWSDQPDAPKAPVIEHPMKFAGECAQDKTARLAKGLRDAGQSATVLTLPDSIMWLLNIRGSDVAHNPVALGFAILHEDAQIDLFMHAEKLSTVDLPDFVRLQDESAFILHVTQLKGAVLVDMATVPQIVADELGDQMVAGNDPCALPKARKNAAEIAGSQAAHIRDGAAVVETLAWLDAQAPGTVSEIDVVKHLESSRRDDPTLREISFDTISGTGPNGAIIHYRVSEESNATLEDGHLLVLDSGGQYLDGTTDITRTLAIGTPGQDERSAYTRVLQGMIAVSQLRWPMGLAGRDIEAFGRAPLWQAGQDFNHGLGHGVGAYLSVHEGPQRLSRLSDVALEVGMILSNEPGYYREGAFGIRIENLIVVKAAPSTASADPERDMLSWKTLTYAPLEPKLIDVALLAPNERNWINSYHSEVRQILSPRLSSSAKNWLDRVTQPL